MTTSKVVLVLVALASLLLVGVLVTDVIKNESGQSTTGDWFLANVKECRSRFAIIGDFGTDTRSEAAVAQLVKSWQPEFVVTTGDNNYDGGEAVTIDKNIGKHYQEYIYPYKGKYGSGAEFNRFWPALGNHDWETPGAKPYLDYFELPHNERYYDFTVGPVHFFSIDSDEREPDGIEANSVQGKWFEEKMKESKFAWQIAIMHHTPYTSSGNHSAAEKLRWPFKEWGADAVIAGHVHAYERLQVNDIPYITNGLGGRTIHGFSTPQPGSEVRYNTDFGAMLVEATPAEITYQFISIKGDVVDRHRVTQPARQTVCDTDHRS